MEVCVDSLESVVAAYEGNANRVELCSSLNEGGLTPSYGLLKSTLKYVENLKRDGFTPIKVNCMLRCRVGDFCYNDNEIETMKEDLKKFIEMDVDGIVFGALNPNVFYKGFLSYSLLVPNQLKGGVQLQCKVDPYFWNLLRTHTTVLIISESDNFYGLVDECLNKEFLKEIPSNSEIKTTFHRAFDVCSDWKECFEKIESIGFNKILTSGQQKTAYEGRNRIKELVCLSNKNKKIQIIAGAGINNSNLLDVLETKCHEFHSSCRSSKFSKMTYRNGDIKMGSPLIDEFEIKITDKLKCQELVDIYQRFLKEKI